MRNWLAVVFCGLAAGAQAEGAMRVPFCHTCRSRPCRILRRIVLQRWTPQPVVERSLSGLRYGTAIAGRRGTGMTALRIVDGWK